MCDVLYQYLQPPGPLTLSSVFEQDLCHVTVADIAPLPPAVSRYAADVLTQLRAAVEHALYAEVQFALGRDLTPDEAPRIEMPATTTAKAFTEWLNAKKRRQLPPLRDGSELVRRMRALQPYRRRDTDEHPMRVLAHHTNLAKHRTPAVAAVRLGRVHTWPLGDPDIVVGAENAPLDVGTVLATGPKYRQVPLSIWPQVAIQRPHTGEWKVIAKEVGMLATWVRTVAIPILVTGEAEAEPPLPPQVDLSKGTKDPREVIRAGGAVPAHQRHLIRMQAHTGRDDLIDTLLLHPAKPDAATMRRWVSGLSDEMVVTRLEELGNAAKRGPLQTADACLSMIRLAEKAGSPSRARDGGGCQGGYGSLPGD